MQWKEFFKPTKPKVIISILSFLIVSGIIFYFFVGDKIGFPLVFHEIRFCWFGLGCASSKTYWLNIIIDVAFWYLITCALLFIYKRFKK